MSEDQRQLLEKLREGTKSAGTDGSMDPAYLESWRKGWRAQGIRMFKRRYYEQAMKCFDHSGD